MSFPFSSIFASFETFWKLHDDYRYAEAQSVNLVEAFPRTDFGHIFFFEWDTQINFRAKTKEQELERELFESCIT